MIDQTAKRLFHVKQPGDQAEVARAASHVIEHDFRRRELRQVNPHTGSELVVAHGPGVGSTQFIPGGQSAMPNRPWLYGDPDWIPKERNPDLPGLPGSKPC